MMFNFLFLVHFFKFWYTNQNYQGVQYLVTNTMLVINAVIKVFSSHQHGADFIYQWIQ
jgi:hypothetical protein